MKFRSLHKWTLGNTTDGLLFFAQRLDELLFDFSLDSFKPPALNPPFLCVEALSLIDDIEAGVIEATNLNHVLEELIWSVQRDTVSKKLLDVKIESHVLLHEVPLAQKRIRLEVLSKTLNSTRYIEKCNELTKEAIAKCCKKDIDKYARSLVTCLINIGLSKTFLYRQVKEYFFQGDVPKITGANDVDGFLEKIYPTVHAFEVYFIVSGQIRTVHKSINGFGIEIMENVPSALSEFATLHGFSKKEDQVFVHVSDINAFDAHAARAEAERRIETLKDLFTLFFHRNSLYWETKTLISQCCSDRLEVIGRRRSSMEKSFDMNPVYAAKRLNWMLDNFALKFGGSFDKFNRIVDLHGICVSNEVPENQLLNLWISLETLVPSNAT